MDARKAIPHQETLKLHALPTEILSQITAAAFIEDQLSLGTTNRFFQSVSNINTIWQQQFKKEFLTPPSFPNAAREQFIAEALFNASITAEINIAQSKFITLLRFLNEHQTKPWTNLYYANLYFYGCGLKQSYSQAAQYLTKALKDKDLRAPRFCYDLLYQLKNNNPKQFKQYHTLFSEHKIYEYLIAILDHNEETPHPIHHTSFLLAWFYRHGIIKSKDFRQAEALYLQAIQHHDIDAVEQLVQLHHEQPRRRHSMIAKDKITRLIQLLKTELKDEYPNSTKAEIHYQLAWQYRIINDLHQQTTHQKYAKQLGHLQARYELARKNHELHRNNPAGKRRAYKEMIALTRLGHKNAAIDVLDLGNHSLSEAAKLLRSLHSDAIYHISATVANTLIQMGSETICDDPSDMCWLLLAAQAGHPGAIHTLTSLNDSANPMAYIALSVVYQFGVLASTKIEINPKRAYAFLSYALDRDQDCIQTFLAANQELGLIGRPVELFLKEFELNYHPRSSYKKG